MYRTKNNTIINTLDGYFTQEKLERAGTLGHLSWEYFAHCLKYLPLGTEPRGLEDYPGDGSHW